MPDDPDPPAGDDRDPPARPVPLAAWVGWYALHRGDRLGGLFATWGRAFDAGLAMYGPDADMAIRRVGPGGVLEPQE